MLEITIEKRKGGVCSLEWKEGTLDLKRQS